MVIICIFLVICGIIAALSPFRVLCTVIALIKNRCSNYDLVMGILSVPLAIFFYGSKLGFTFPVAFEFAAFLGMMALTGDVLTAVVFDFVKFIRKAR